MGSARVGRTYNNWYDLPDDPLRVGDTDYQPLPLPRPPIDEDEAYERWRQQELDGAETEIGNSRNEEERK